MFKSIKKRTLFYQIMAVVCVMTAVFVFITLYTYSRLNVQVGVKLEEIKKSYIEYFDIYEGENKLNSGAKRSALIITINKDGSYRLSNHDFLDETSMKKLFDNINVDVKNKTNKLTIDGNRIVYEVFIEPSTDTTAICCYDYTTEYDAFVFNLLTTLLSILILFVIVGALMARFTKKTFVPIEEAFHKQQELVANASHELKTPITIINTNVSILSTGNYDWSDEQKKWLDGISTQVKRMSEMINEMLELARVEGTKNVKEYEKINFSEILETAVLETETVMFEKGIELVANVTPSLFVMGKRADLEKLAYILIENAVKYTTSGKKIYVELSLEKHKLIYSVKNEGDGIPPEKIPKLFDRFYRCDESHAPSGSFGLGLSIAKAIVENHNGRIGVESKENEYTRFVCVFKAV